MQRTSQSQKIGGKYFSVMLLFLVILTLFPYMSWETLFEGKASRMVVSAGLADVGSSFRLQCSVALLLIVLMALSGVIGLLYRNLCRQAARIDALMKEACTDACTGVLNRRGFDIEFHRLLEHAKREGNPISLLFMDVDDFKSINDACGHDIGDLVLRELSKCIQKVIRRPLDCFARWGGEEFAVVLHNAPIDKTLVIANGIRECLKEVCKKELLANGQEPLTLSIGVAHLVSGADTSAEDLFRSADRALLSAKRQGRNKVVLAG
jgi:diguanylate cyclase (GGDEF)-like protein